MARRSIFLEVDDIEVLPLFQLMDYIADNFREVALAGKSTLIKNWFNESAIRSQSNPPMYLQLKLVDFITLVHGKGGNTLIDQKFL